MVYRFNFHTNICIGGSKQLCYIIRYNFSVRGEEGIWGEWSDWIGCDSPSDHVATRTRQCFTRDTFQVTNVDRCLLIPGSKGDLDILPCKKYKAMMQRKENEDVSVLFKKNGERWR